MNTSASHNDIIIPENMRNQAYKTSANCPCSDDSGHVAQRRGTMGGSRTIDFCANWSSDQTIQRIINKGLLIAGNGGTPGRGSTSIASLHKSISVPLSWNNRQACVTSFFAYKQLISCISSDNDLIGRYIDKFPTYKFSKNCTMAIYPNDHISTSSRIIHSSSFAQVCRW